ncbi:hypothetical protein BJ322DRAFT_1112532 [Thelephora terrestris]|uniref:NB-ARC domain-containing protein n=1 Tax=Thelephora terrestris TaxID=56493 RepID=A0A9P6H749_9AGAM|nr:hypothetical protein BJ322DRAFT_1112532 [Thelephora terrestris]
MASTSQRTNGPDGVLRKLDMAIQFLTASKDACGVAPAQIALGSACALLNMIRDTISNKQGFIEELNGSMLRAIEQLTTRIEASICTLRSLLTDTFIYRRTIGEIQKNVEDKGEQHRVVGFLNAKGDKDLIAGWRQELVDVLPVFNVHRAGNTHVMVAGTYAKVLEIQEGARSIQASSPPGELRPPRPRACFGRDGLIEKIVGLAATLSPIALIGTGGIGKTSLALAVLHHERIKERFGDNRRFIPAATSSKLPKPISFVKFQAEMFIVLYNAESILDPQGTDARELHTMVKELRNTSNICICITSRISTIPLHCTRLELPTLSMEAARDIFYSIYDDSERSGINHLGRCLGFLALSITLLATTASNNLWSFDRLAKEWDKHHVRVLQVDYNESLAATIEFSLASPTFRKLGPNVRELTIDVDACEVWDGCYPFMEHLHWQKPRQMVLRLKVEALPDGHSFKAKWLGSVGNHVEEKRVLKCILTIQRERGDAFQAAVLNSTGGGSIGSVPTVRNAAGQAICLDNLARLFLDDNQLDAAQDAVSRKTELLPVKGQKFRLCQSHRLLGTIYRSKGEKEKAVCHFEMALAIATPFDWQGELFWIHYDLAWLFRDQDEFDDANAHIDKAKPYAADSAHNLGRTMEMQARVWHRQHRLEEARSGVLCALEIYERLGAAKDIEDCRGILQEIEKATESPISNETDFGGETSSCDASSDPC